MTHLLLIPTPFERARLPTGFEASLGAASQVECIGFGPVAAAARTAQLIGQLQPSAVLLVGIAGAYDERTPMGQAFQFAEVAIDGVGVGEADHFRSALSLGWRQTAEIPCDGEVIQLEPESAGPPSLPRLVTCCAASNDPREAARRAARHDSAAAEDMEGYAVALACELSKTRCHIVRGVSNVAGDRDKSRWQIDEALAAAAEGAFSILQSIRDRETS